jgi:predicted permease
MFERWWTRARLRLKALVGRNRIEQEIDDELRDHLIEAQAHYEARGLSPEAARRAARLDLGGVEPVKDALRDVGTSRFMTDVVQDLRYGARMLRRSPRVSLLAILCLTLGIGANAAVFGWIEGLLLRPFPGVAHQERMYAMVGTREAERTSVSWPDFLDLQQHSTLVEAFIADSIMGTTLSIGDRAERATGSVVSANYFDAIGVRPILGRGFLPGEDSGRNAHAVTVISYDAWQLRYRGAADIIGRTQVLNGMPFTIIGVTPPGFRGTFVGYQFQFWVPASMEEQFRAGGYKLEDRGARWIEGFVRLKPGVTQAQAQQELSALASRLEVDYPATNRGQGLRLFPLSQTPFNQAGNLLPTLQISLAVVVAVLLIACANVSNLLLVRALGRRQEITIRLALGAGRGRVLRQLLPEGVLLSALAAIGALVMAWWCRNALVLFFPPQTGGIIVSLAGDLDWRVLIASALVCALATLVFGLTPALHSSKMDVAAVLRSEATGVIGGRARSRLRSALVVAQVALSFVLLVGVGLLLLSLKQTRDANPGFLTTGVVATGFDLRAAGYSADRAAAFEDELIDRLQGTAGIESAAFSRVRPFTYAVYSSAPIEVVGYVPRPNERPTVEYNEVSPAYFTTFGIPLVSGRAFTRQDDSRVQPVAIINEAMAAQFWPGRDALDEQFQAKGRSIRIVGIAKQAKYGSITEATKPFYYVPLRQNLSLPANLSLRTPMRPSAVAAVVLEKVRTLDPNLAPLETITMREQVDRSEYTQTLAVALLSVFGGLALVLAAIGLYGVLSYAVSQGARELGLRLALGAEAAAVFRLVLSRGFGLAAGGITLGAMAALGLTRLMGYLLFQVSPRDPRAFLSALAVMAVAAFLACVVPAWRAARTDPSQTLRT